MALQGGEIQVTAPHIYTSICGSREQVIQMTSGNLQRALILCLLVYYVNCEAYL